MTRQYSEKELVSPIPPDEQALLLDFVSAVNQLPKEGGVERCVYMEFRRAALALEEFYVKRHMDVMAEDDYFNRYR